MNRIFLLASLLLLSTPTLRAAELKTEVPARVKLFDPATISQQTLPNGVRSIVEEATGGDLVSIQVWVRAGSRFETNQNNGATHVIETLALGASQNYPAKTNGPRGALESLGGAAGSLTARDSLFFSATVAAPFLPAALKILADATLHPDLSDARVAAAKADALSEIIANASNPTSAASDLAYAAMFNNHPYHLPAQGSSVSLSTLTGAAVRAFHAARFGGKNISVIIVGDASRLNAHKLVAQYFGATSAPAAAPAILSDKPISSVIKTSRKGVLPISTTTLAWRSPPLSDSRDVVALDVLLSHWKDGRDAALKKILRAPSLKEEGNDESSDSDKGDDDASTPAPDAAPDAPPKDAPEKPAPLALGFDADFLTQRDSGLSTVTLIAPRDRDEAIAAILEEVARVQREGLSQSELQSAKAILSHQYTEQSDTVNGLGGALGFYDSIGDYQFAATYLDRVARVSNEDIKHLANTYFSTQAYVQATIEGRTETRPPDAGGTITAGLWKQDLKSDMQQGATTWR